MKGLPVSPIVAVISSRGFHKRDMERYQRRVYRQHWDRLRRPWRRGRRFGSKNGHTRTRRLGDAGDRLHRPWLRRVSQDEGRGSFRCLIVTTFDAERPPRGGPSLVCVYMTRRARNQFFALAQFPSYSAVSVDLTCSPRRRRVSAVCDSRHLRPIAPLKGWQSSSRSRRYRYDGKTSFPSAIR
jgi:hypothetical protein